MALSPWNQRIKYIEDRAGQEAMTRLKPLLADPETKRLVDDFYAEKPTISTCVGGKSPPRGRYLGFQLYIPREPAREGIILLRVVMDSQSEEVTYFKVYIPPMRGCDLPKDDEASFWAALADRNAGDP